jgi:hypothetical protein
MKTCNMHVSNHQLVSFVVSEGGRITLVSLTSLKKIQNLDIVYILRGNGECVSLLQYTVLSTISEFGI